MVLIADLVQYIVESIDSVDHLADIRLLDLGHRAVGKCVDLQAFSVTVRIPIDSIDIVGRVDLLI